MKVGQFSVSLDQMFDLLHGHVIDAIPVNERSDYYSAWSEGALALNLIYGVNRVNPRQDMYMHVANMPRDDDYRYKYAHSHATMLAHGAYAGHFSREELGELASLAGRDLQDLQGTPAIVLGFSRRQHELTQHPKTIQQVIGHAVSFSEIDPYSRDMLSELWGIDLASLPPTPNAVRTIPESPPPDII